MPVTKRKEVTKQGFCKILGRTLRLWGSLLLVLIQFQFQSFIQFQFQFHYHSLITRPVFVQPDLSQGYYYSHSDEMSATSLRLT